MDTGRAGATAAPPVHSMEAIQIGTLRAGVSQSCVDGVGAAVGAKVQWWFNTVDLIFQRVDGHSQWRSAGCTRALVRARYLQCLS